MDSAEKIADAVIQKIRDDKHVFWVDPETHAEQHEFLQMLMTERAEKLARRKAIEDKIAGSLILSFILALIGLIGAGAMGWVREHIK